MEDATRHSLEALAVPQLEVPAEHLLVTSFADDLMVAGEVS